MIESWLVFKLDVLERKTKILPFIPSGESIVRFRDDLFEQYSSFGIEADVVQPLERGSLLKTERPVVILEVRLGIQNYSVEERY